MDSEREPAFDRFTKLAARMLSAPVSLVSLVNEDRQFFKSSYGLPEPLHSLRGTPLTHSFCKHLLGTCQPLVIDDTREDTRFADNPAVVEWGALSYLGIPIQTAEGLVMGSLCVIDRRPRHWSAEETDSLLELAQCVVLEIRLRIAVSEREDLLDVLDHDLKDPLSALLLTTDILLRRDASESSRWSAASAFRQIQGYSLQMRNVLNGVTELRDAEAGKLRFVSSPTEAEPIIRKAVEGVHPAAERHGISVHMKTSGSGRAHVVNMDPERLLSALSSLFSALVDCAQPGQGVEIWMKRESGSVRLHACSPSARVSAAESLGLFENAPGGTPTLRRGTRLKFHLSDTLFKLMGCEVSLRNRARDAGLEVRVRLPAS